MPNGTIQIMNFTYAQVRALNSGETVIWAGTGKSW